MLRPWKDPWGLSPRLRPCEAWPVLTDLCGCSQPVEPPWLSHDAYVGRVCHSCCGGDRRSRHLVRLLWVNRFFGSQTIAVRTRDLKRHTIPSFTFIYRSYLLIFGEFHPSLGNLYRLCGTLESCGDINPSMCLSRKTPPSGYPGCPPPCLGVIEPAHGLI